MHFLDILEIFRLVMGQITSNLLKKQFAFLSTSIMFCNMFARACAEIKILRAFGCESDLCLLKALRFLFLLFFSFCCSIWPSTGLASSVKNSEKASSRWAIFLSHVYWQEILLWVFYSTFWACLCISQALLGQSRWSGYHWKDNLYSHAEVEYWGDYVRSGRKAKGSSRPVTAGRVMASTGVNWLVVSLTICQYSSSMTLFSWVLRVTLHERVS